MINSLDAILAERNLVQTCPLSALTETRIGIELDVYLRSILFKQGSDANEPYVAALGGAPLSLISHIENDLRTLERSRIKPVFVLSGLAPNRKSRPFTLDDPKTRLRALAWEAYEEGDVDRMQDLLTRSSSTDINDVVRSVLRAFRHRNVEFIVAPYLATAQLVSLERHPRGYAHSIYGSTTLLLYPRVDRVILDVDFTKGVFSYVSKAALVADLGLRTDDDFLDVGVLAGWEHGSTFPPLYDGTLGPVPAAATAAANAASQGESGAGHPMSPEHQPINFRQAVDLVRQYRNGNGVCHAFADHPIVRQRAYVDQFYRSKAMIKFSLVVRAEDGAVLPLPLATSPSLATTSAGTLVNGAANGSTLNGAGSTSSEIPSDLGEIFSPRLPDEVFLHLSRGLVSPHVHNWLASTFLVVPPPLDNGDTQEYRRFVRESLVESPQSPNCVALALATSALNSFWSGRRVHAVYWHTPQGDKTIPFESKATQQLVSRVGQWNVPAAFVEEELRRQNSSTIDIALCIGATGSNELASRTKTTRRVLTGGGGNHQLSHLDKKDEIVANVIWRMLELRGFLNHDHLHTPYARALHLALRASRLNDKLQEPLYLTLELIRAGALHANHFTSPGGPNNPPAGEAQVFSGGPAFPGAEHETRSLLLVMRCLSLVPMQFKPDAWTAPVSRELLVFNSFARSLNRSMRNLVEQIASTMLLRSDARRSRDDYLDIALSLPFQTDTNAGLGIVMKCYVEAFIAFHDGAPTVEDMNSVRAVGSREEVLGMLEENFYNVRNVRGELQRGFRYWSCLMIAVRQLRDKESVSQDVVRDFEAADQWLAGFAC